MILVFSDNELWIKDYIVALEELGMNDLVEIIDFNGDVMPDLPDPNGVDLIFSRASPSASFRGRRYANEHMLEALHIYEQSEVPVINGSRPTKLEFDKAAQFEMLESCDILIPNTIPVRNIQNVEQIIKAAKQISGPFLIKPNKGGSGKGIQGFDSIEEMLQAYPCRTTAEKMNYEPGTTVIVQQQIPFDNPNDPHIYRAEFIGRKLYYVVKTKVSAGQYNNCAADSCQEGKCDISPAQDNKFTIVDEPLIETDKLHHFLCKTGSEIAGIEFIKYDGQLYCIDSNLSNTNYGKKQEKTYFENTGIQLSGHKKVAEFISLLYNMNMKDEKKSTS